jgi:hypothetical protein
MTRKFAADADDDEVERLRALLTEGIHTERACQKRALLAEAALAEEKAHADRTNACSLHVNKENERLRAALAEAREMMGSMDLLETFDAALAATEAMSDDLVQRLRQAVLDKDNFPRMDSERQVACGLAREAAAEIERLRAEIANQHVEITHWHDKFEAAEAALATAREALEFFADHDNWRRGRKLDPNSANFIGRIHALAALAALAAMEPPDA